ncbi:MAG: tRNA (adenosine(37)-N6)-threonylcarbamoyltransferase complex ATPase subunit type 1 TsaE [Planctomycetes bacterium]|nr:tRNA (adenosine(37)-N6)-threonylcarbamoyltransferase complex ATPase subunit type 1 TsaE [Planctomycetota bacterium]
MEPRLDRVEGFRYRSLCVADTIRLGESFGMNARVGLVLILSGPLGAGKTHFVRGLARGLGIESGVRSPTFTICQVYPGRIDLYHLDAYRVDDPDELLLQGFDEMVDSGVVAIEWGERVTPILPVGRIELQITPAGEEEREIRAVPRGELEHAWLGDLPAELWLSS